MTFCWSGSRQSLTSTWRGCCWFSVQVSRANYYLRVVHPDLASPFAEQHDAKVWRCLQRLVGIEGDSLTKDMASLPLCFGGLGLRSAVRTSPVAHWASWADCLPTIQSGILELPE